MAQLRRGAASRRALLRVGRRRSVEIRAADTANVPALTMKATESGATTSRTAPIAGPTTTPRSCTVCSRALAGPNRDSPTSLGSSASAAGRSALPAAEASAVNAMTSRTGPSHGHHGGEPEHQQAPQQVAGEQHRAPVVAVGDHAADGAEQDEGQQPADRGRADPARRTGGLVDVAQQHGVVEPVAQLRGGARADQRSRIRHAKDVAIQTARAQLGRAGGLSRTHGWRGPVVGAGHAHILAQRGRADRQR